MLQTKFASAAAAALWLCFCAPFTLAEAPASRPTTRDVRAKVDDREQEAQLLGERAKDLFSRARDRMQDSARKLAQETDPGPETQEIQRRIVADIDEMIDKLTPPKSPPPPPNGDRRGTPADRPPTGGQQALGPATPADATRPADHATRPRPAAPANPPRSRFQEDAQAFLQICPRLPRSAIIEGAGEDISQKYRGMTEAYYRAVAREAER